MPSEDPMPDPGERRRLERATSEQAEMVRDVIAIVTALVHADMDAALTVVEQTEDPRLTLAGVCGFLDELLPQYAHAAGIDLDEVWGRVATDASMLLAQGRRP